MALLEHEHAPVYRSILGQIYHVLPRQIQDLHDETVEKTARGHVRIEGGGHGLNRFLARLFHLPKPSDDVPIELTRRIQGEKESWQIVFGDETLSFSQEIGKGRESGMVVGRIGPVTLPCAVRVRNNGLFFKQQGASIFGIPLPRFLWLRLCIREAVIDGHYVFDVTVDFPFVGRLLRCRGNLRTDSFIAMPDEV